MEDWQTGVDTEACVDPVYVSITDCYAVSSTVKLVQPEGDQLYCFKCWICADNVFLSTASYLLHWQRSGHTLHVMKREKDLIYPDSVILSPFLYHVFNIWPLTGQAIVKVRLLYKGW